MASFNKVILIGNLTRDPETRVTANGTTICKIPLAVSRKFSTRDGERREETCFVDVDAFGKQAEVLAKYCTKGRPLCVEGRLKLDQWENKDGAKRNKLGVILENFQFLPTGNGKDDSDNNRTSHRGASDGADDDPLDEDVPF